MRNQYLDLVIYQIYPKSFMDSDGDGLGDINGIASKLEYIRALGVNAIWICPMYKSPQCDNGYDISDYRAFQEEYGSMSDFEALVEKAHSLGIKVIMDLVANHTSSEHFWFQEAKKSKENPYHDYYYWADKPLTDWTACFGGSTWEYNEETGEYYLHSFAVGQPDVNWTNPKVRKEYCDIVDFWVSKGVDGFRCDVLDYISKDFETGKMYNGSQLHEYIRELFDRDGVRHIFTVGECQSDEQSICDICGTDRKELTCIFQFEHIHLDHAKDNEEGRFIKAPCKISDVAEVLKKWQNFAQKNDLIYTLFTDNHDQPWFNSRKGNDKEYRYESATMFATMFYMLKGIPFVFQGQEMGSANSKFDSIEYFDDIETVNYYKDYMGKISQKELMDRINFGTRDHTRRPMAWKNGEGFGFTTAERPWVPYPTRSSEINVEADLKSKKSVTAYYKKIFSLRESNEVLRYGDFKDLSQTKDCFVYERNWCGQTFVIVCNFEKSNSLRGYEIYGELVLSNTTTQRNGVDGEYYPFEAAVFKVI